MTLPEILALVALVVAALTGAGLAFMYRHLWQYQRNQRVIMGSRGDVDIVQHVAALDEKLTNVRIAVEDLALAVRDHDVRIDSSFSRLGIVRFDAYNDLGGRQSTAIALLNSTGDGVIMTTVVSRDFARTYVKLIKNGQSDIPLAPEEIEAVNQARGSAPFTVRPRVQSTPDEDGSTTETQSVAEGAPIALGLPGVRGVAERKVVPSTRGWDQPTTPAGPTLAEKFVRARKSGRENGDLGES